MMDTQVIILAAGSGRRMYPLTQEIPKALLRYQGQTLLERVVEQAVQQGLGRITVVVGHGAQEVKAVLNKLGNVSVDVVENPRFREDKNILSLALALQYRMMPFLVIEGDMILPDDSWETIVSSKAGQSAWFTTGCFKPGMYGGIVRVDNSQRVVDLKIVPEYESLYHDYLKLTGMLRVGPNQLDCYYRLLADACQEDTDQYYHAPWSAHIGELESYVVDLSGFEIRSVNTIEEYYLALGVILIDVDSLRAIEGYSKKRVKWLSEKILAEGVWRKPLAVEKEHHLVLDGMHRLEVAKLLDLAYIPCQLFSYEDVDVWSLRKQYEVSKEIVVRRALMGDIYPYKTAKHRFSTEVENCCFPLNILKKTKG